MDCLAYSGKQQLSPYQQPKEIENSSLDVKPATLNSSFVQSGCPSKINDNEFNLLENQSQELKENENNVISKIKNQNKNLFTNLIKKLLFTLRRATNEYKSITELILEEKYLEIESIYFTNTVYNLFFTFMSDVLIVSISLIILINIPVQMCFEIEASNITNGVIIIIFFIEVFIISDKPFKLKSEVINTIAILIVFISLQFIVNNSILQVIFLIILFISSMIKLAEKVERLQDYISNDISLVSLIVKIFLFIHQCACLWFLIGNMNPISWISESEINELDLFKKYCHSFYLATGNLLGIGQSNIILITEEELIYSSVIMIASCFMISYIYNQITNIYFVSHKQKRKIKNQLTQINSYFRKRNVPLEVQYEVRRAFNLKLKKQFECDELLNSHPEISNWLKEKAIKDCKHIMQFSRNTQKFTQNQLKYVNYPSNTIINNDCSLFIIEDGEIQVLEYGKQVKVLGIGDSFGEYSFFSGQQIKTQFKSSTQTQVYQINRQEFYTYIQQNSQDLEKFMFIKDSLFNNVINLYCLSCQSNKKENVFRDGIINEKIKFLLIYLQKIDQFQVNLKGLEKLREKYWESQEQPEAIDEFQSCSDESSYHLTKKSEKSKSGSTKNKQSSQSQQFQKIHDNFNQQFNATPQFDEIFEVPGQKIKFQIIDTDTIMEPKETSQKLPTKQGKENESLGKILQLCNTSSLKQQSKEIDPTSLNVLNKYSDDQTSLHQIKKTKNSFKSMPSRNTINRSIIKKFPSQLSQITKRERQITISRYKLNRQNCGQLKLPSALEMVNLSQFNYEEEEEFEKMYHYSIYYPKGNAQSVIDQINRYRKKYKRRIFVN